MSEKATVVKNFLDVVNMTEDELAEWLETEESNSTGQLKPGQAESIGHESGRHLLELMRCTYGSDPDTYNDEQIAFMRRVVSYCRRHLAQFPRNKALEEIRAGKWYWSLKNWGHDALKESNDEDEIE
ncbi:hypothetical protein SAICODRAFT_17756 [Saitoella complicata NRRL Y-17804]|nr:uncharacterized protein SAICODRAFT_17756 [Saitoella complicata NRRL Y-17804]ODQ54767.1 hypothetical protein SAICODRAFT_17756 [Saitoella complicata NRRL Y-17804]